MLMMHIRKLENRSRIHGYSHLYKRSSLLCSKSQARNTCSTLSYIKWPFICEPVSDQMVAATTRWAHSSEVTSAGLPGLQHFRLELSGIRPADTYRKNPAAVASLLWQANRAGTGCPSTPSHVSHLFNGTSLLSDLLYHCIMMPRHARM